MKKNLNTIIIWGALWGIEEATVGHILHITALNLGWILWFPLAWFFMSQVWRRTKSPSAILLTTLISSAVKLVNLFSPIPAQFVIYPAFSIILEGLALSLAVKLFCKDNALKWNRIAGITLISFAWRAAYLASVFLISQLTVASYPYAGVPALCRFLFFEGLANSILIYAAISATGFTVRKLASLSGIPTKIKTSFPFNRPAIAHTLSFLILIMAFAIQILI